ncbi:glycosyl hydrolase family 62 [Streptomyces azureus]|uniref:Glycosyl hydrolase family 62 n=1 Tax=Streptomyces azureus TaxID=146537 RepID=A0A0K8PTH3_STRAJ|nr:glycosyl hydrolase family 62 [Streptomyces azureus]
MLRDAVWERFHTSHVHVTMPIGRFPSGEGGSMRTPRMRTFVNGPVFMLAVGVLALVPGPAHAGAPQPGRTRDLGAAR